MVMNDALKELAHEMRVQNRLLLMLYTHMAIGWDAKDLPANLFAQEKERADSLLDLIEQSLGEE